MLFRSNPTNTEGTSHVLKEIETVFASVGLAVSGGNSPAPLWVENQQGKDNSQGRKGSEDEEKLARVDAGFFVTPESTESADDNTRFDIVLFSEKPVSYDLYYRILDTQDSNSVILSDDKRFEEHKLSSDNTMETGPNGWVYLGNTTSNWSSGQAWDMGAIHQDCIGTTTFPLLKKLGEGLTYEFAISVTEKDGNRQWESWNDRFNIQVCVLAGNQANLRNALVTRNDTPETVVGDGVQAISNPSFVSPLVQFVDSVQPKFYQTQPTFGEGDTFQELTFGLDNPGTLYYVVAPRSNSTQPPLPATIKLTDKAKNELSLTEESLSATDTKFWDVITKQTESKTRGDLTVVKDPITNQVTEHLDYYQVDNLPNRNNIVNARNVYRQYISGSYKYESRDGAPEKMTIPDPTSSNMLDPKNEYYIYIVLEGASGNPQSRSNVYIYNFKTTETARPKIYLQNFSGGTVGISTTNDPPISSAIDYALFTTSDLLQLNTIFTREFAGYVKNDLKSEYTTWLGNKNLETGKKYTVLDALMEDYTDGSVFDHFATDGLGGLKEDIARIIRSQAGGDPIRGTVSPTAVGVGRTQTVDRTTDMRPGEYYYLLAVGHHVSGVTDGFKAIDNVVVPDTEPPKVQTITTSAVLTADNKVNPEGTVTITFDKPVYWIQADASSGSRQPVLNTNNANASGGKAVVSVVAGSKSYTLQNGEQNPTSAARTFTFNIKDWTYNDSFTFFAGDGRLANASGRSAASPVTMRLNFRRAQTGDSGIVMLVGYFTATWLDEDGRQQTYAEP